MPTLTVRSLSPDVYQALKDRAQARERSMEAEAREIITSAVNSNQWWDEWVKNTEALRGEFPVPERSMPRDVSL